jgi:hypothetical protein
MTKNRTAASERHETTHAEALEIAKAVRRWGWDGWLTFKDDPR